MITLQDCIDMSDLTNDLVNTIAEHEHLPSILAMELGDNLLASPEGRACIRRFLEDDLAAARRCRDAKRLAAARRNLQRFTACFPAGGDLS